ncbi:toprim domain-containing protein [Vibrio sp. 10N.222.51.C8]|jgi:hypothetical protein|uniref:Toprim domain-containing protein n=3 Tax=Vibrio TaxID=662 RepID=A0A7Z1S219_9VIBR|nr:MULTISPECIES: toprim domain-containing protein [Vibrio]NOH36207.1 hypothetical protein [Vibrio chagasii]PML50598.1 hypothetical protein BCT81_11080 [Vibrio sp. 10N.261.52.A1]PMP17596.1 hypothetical protein BCS91_25885 [Vibrio cyclitrophicus]PMP28122.1 hypothetical protein BCS90_19975 [Vibrio cyclitrophicus]TKG08611.1 hypothetical protein FCV67_09010 [Vibrio sp. F13]
MSNYRRSKIQDVHALVMRHGGWSSVFKCYGELTEAMRKSSNGVSKAVPDPFTGKGKTVFRLYKDWNESGGGYYNGKGRIGDGIDMVAWLENCNKSKAMDIILDILGESTDNISQREVKAVAAQKEEKAVLSPADISKRLWILQKVEHEAFAVTESEIGMNYLISRGLGDIQIPCNVGFHSQLKMWDSQSNEVYLPGIVLYIQNLKGEAIAFHRIFLNDDGSDKSPLLDNPKMQMSPIEDPRGASIQFGMPLICKDEMGNTRIVLGVGEGPETCLACQHAESIPVWSGISSTLMELIDIPFEVTDLVIFKDKDRLTQGKDMPEGDRAAISLKERVEKNMNHCKVTIASPPSPIKELAKSQDWLDEWCDSGYQNFIGYLAKNKLTPVGFLDREFNDVA